MTKKDTILFNLINEELERQRHGVELIASENFTSQGSHRRNGQLFDK